MTTATTENIPTMNQPARGQQPAAAQTTSSPTTRRLDPLEVGWQFVQEYYTILNKDPNRLHCFYNKQSVMLHGVEAETVKQCVGQQDIHKRFKELELQESRVIISNVDSQASLAGGILICVLGELQTLHTPSRKFAQTFFLAEQPNGYYVHNDMFRFLKEDYDDMELPVEEPEPEVANGHVEAAAVEEAPVKEEKVASWTKPIAVPMPAPAAPVSDAPTPAPVATPVPAPEKPTPVETPVPAAATAPAAKPVPAEQPIETVKPATVEEETQSQPKSWASLADNGKERWAKHAATEVKAAVVPPVNQREPTERKKPSGKENVPYKQRNHDTDAAVFVRGFTKLTKLTQLKEEFLKQIGPLRWVELTSESTAYIEFNDMEHVKKGLETGKITINGETVFIESKDKGGPRRLHNGRQRSSGNKLSKAPSKGSLNKPIVKS